MEPLQITNLIRAALTNNRAKAREEIYYSAGVMNRTKTTPKGCYLPDLFLRDISNNSAWKKTQTDAKLSEVAKQSVLELLGVQVVTGLTVEITVPKITASANAEWLVEGTSASGGDPTTGSATLSAKTLYTKLVYSKTLFHTLAEGAEEFVMNDSNAAAENALLLALCEGSGTSGQPTGLENDSAVSNVSGVSFGLATALSIIKTAEAATNKRNFFWLTSPALKETLSKREKISGESNYLCEENKMLGFPVLAIKDLGANKIFFGDFSSVLLGQFGNDMDVLVDAVTQHNYNRLIAHIYRRLDFVFRNPTSLVKCVNFS